MAEKRRPCLGGCQKNRAERFFPADRRRADGKSDVCTTCRRRKSRGGNRAQHLMETYGITLEEYDALLAAQGGRCAICRGKRTGNLDVDHSHKIEKELGETRPSVRGLLCRRCNRRLLPASTDRVEILQQAIEYLTNPPAQAVLGASTCGSAGAAKGLNPEG